MNTKKELQQIIEQSELNSDDKVMWATFISKSKDEDLIDILTVMKDAPENIALLTNDMTKKIDAFLLKDSNKLNQVLEDEEAVLQTLAN